MGARATRLTGCSVHHPRTGAPEAVPPPQRRWPAAPGAHGSRTPPTLAPAPGTAPPRGVAAVPRGHALPRNGQAGGHWHGAQGPATPARTRAPHRQRRERERGGAGYNSPHTRLTTARNRAWRGVAWRGVAWRAAGYSPVLSEP